MMPVGPRALGPASCAIAVPIALPLAMRGKMRELVRVAVPVADRGKGHASDLLASVTMESDRTRTGLLLTVEPGDGLDRNQLAAWYARLGFLPIQAEPLLMARMSR